MEGKIDRGRKGREECVKGGGRMYLKGRDWNGYKRKG